MFFRKYGDMIIAIFFIILSFCMIILAKQLPKSAVMEIGPDFMPIVIGILTLVLSLILFIISVREYIKFGDAIPECKECFDYKSVLFSFLSIFVYIFALQPIGFIISTIIYLPVQMLILAPADKRRKKDIFMLCIISVIFSLAVFILFRYGFKIILPTGIFSINL